MTPAGLQKHFAKLPRTQIAIEAGAQCRWECRQPDPSRLHFSICLNVFAILATNSRAALLKA
jgi:hypothetical protein